METPTTGRPMSDAPGAGRRWTRFLAGLLGIWLFAFVAVPLLQRLDSVREVRAVLDRSGIDATALFYTESEPFGEAEASIRNSLKYSAHGSTSHGIGFRHNTRNTGQ